ncbi:MAG: GGDEF domain-containing protein [Marinicella sp.]
MNHKTNLLGWLFLLFIIAPFKPANSTLVGRPPIIEIDIPSEPYITIFDMAQDQNNVIYVSYDKGIKIYDGSRWQTLLIPDTYLTRILYFDPKDRVYVGGFNFFGYINRDLYGVYEFIDLTPTEKPIDFASIWGITGCNDRIFFQALNHVFEFTPTTGDMNTWSFVGKLGDIACINNQVLIQDRSQGLKQLVNNVWQDSDIKLQDNSLIYELEALENNAIFIRSLSDNWRLIENNQIKPIRFNAQLPELGSFASSLTLDNNQIVMGGKDGSLTFFDFNTYTTESFKLSSDWIASITKANDGGLLILSNFTIYHVSWPSPWRIQDSDTGLSSDIFDLTTWNDQLYATSRAGVFVEDSKQSTQQHKLFKQLNWTAQEAWNLLPLNDEEMLLADSHYAYIIKDNEKQIITDVIYPRVFQRSKFNPNHIFMRTELDTRLLVRNGDAWSDWVVAEGKPRSVVEQAADTLLITTEDGRFYKVLLSQDLASVEANIDLSIQANISPKEISKLKLFEGPDNKIIAATSKQYYQYTDQTFHETDLNGLKKLLKPEYLSDMGIEEEIGLWASSATQVFIHDELNQWRTIDTTPYIQGGIYDLEFYQDQVNISGNSVILSYLMNQAETPETPTGHMMITAAKLSTVDGSRSLEIPLKSDKPFVVGSGGGGLTFQYSFTDIKNASQSQYQYRLKGHNSQWSPLSNNTQASFLELPAGNYAFEVRAADITGRKHTSQLLPFIIEPVWYLSSLAKFIWLIITLALTALLMKLFLKWRERKHEEQKQALKTTINEKTQALKLANQALQDLAHKDSLTGLSNRLYLDLYIKQMIKNRVETFSILMMDMDHFKKYNDSFGHLAGDQLLEKFAQSLMSRIKRQQDLTARYGGEEFLVIMPNATKENTLRAAENIRLHTEQQVEKTTISIGVAFVTKEHEIRTAKDIFAVIDQADKALYEAKTTGRNQVVVYNESVEQLV